MSASRVFAYIYLRFKLTNTLTSVFLPLTYFRVPTSYSGLLTGLLTGAATKPVESDAGEAQKPRAGRRRGGKREVAGGTFEQPLLCLLTALPRGVVETPSLRLGILHPEFEWGTP